MKAPLEEARSRAKRIQGRWKDFYEDAEDFTACVHVRNVEFAVMGGSGRVAHAVPTVTTQFKLAWTISGCVAAQSGAVVMRFVSARRIPAAWMNLSRETRFSV
jgi:hypothetical protein